jgi:hypothetical protein
MVKTTVIFRKIVGIDHQIGTEDQFMHAIVHFNLKVGNIDCGEMTVGVKQTAGSTFDEASFEVTTPHESIVRLNYEAFHTGVSAYYERFFNRRGTGAVSVENNTRNQNFIGCTYKEEYIIEFDVPDSGTSW